jgi:pimeloyl-ACP methyl ester carboxylesterase
MIVLLNRCASYCCLTILCLLAWAPPRGLSADVTNAPPVEWSTNFGGILSDQPNIIQQTSDGGYIVGGFSYSSFSGNKGTTNYGLNDYWVLRLEPDGKKRWETNFGGNSIDQLYAIRQTADGGFLLGGNSYSAGGTGNKTATNYGGSDIWLIRLNTNGALLWQTNYGGSAIDGLFSMTQVADGGFALGGYSGSTNGNKSSPFFGALDYWLVRIDTNGNKLWDKTYGGSGYDYLQRVVATSDGGFLLGGFSDSTNNSGNKVGTNYGGLDYWVVRVDSNGSKLWDKSYGGTNVDQLASLRVCTNGDFLLAGYSNSGASGNKSAANLGLLDFWILRANKDGVPLWDRTFGGTSNDVVYCAELTLDEHLLVGGSSQSLTAGGKSSPTFGGEDMWLINVDTNGNKVWEQSFGGSSQEQLLSIGPTDDGGMVLAGYTKSHDGTQTNPVFGAGDFWLSKLLGEPLIFIPGMAASDLYSGSDKLWLSILPEKILRLTLDPTGTPLPDPSISPLDASRTFLGVDIYQSLFDRLAQEHFKEFRVNGMLGRPEIATEMNDHPNLFVFPYDWRMSSAQAAQKLRDFIAGIHRFYPGTKVNILAHSNGGLVARRYLLDNPHEHYINKMITMGTPYLGAPVAIYRMEKGRFFGHFYIDVWNSGTVKKVAEFFPGVHELLPSYLYFNLAGSAYVETGYDINGNGTDHEPYNYDEFVQLMNDRFRSFPGSANARFHSMDQDDSSADSGEVQTLHIVGNQSSLRTVTRIEVHHDYGLDADTLLDRPYFKEIYGHGDQTVPYASSARSCELLAPNTQVIEMAGEGSFFARDGYYDSEVEHTALPVNKVVQDHVMNFLHNKPLKDARTCGATAALALSIPGTESLYISIVGVPYVGISDAFGNTNAQLNGEFALSVPNVDYNLSGTNAISLVMPAEQRFDITFQPGSDPINISVLRGHGTTAPSLAFRYLDLKFPSTVSARMTIATNSTVNLYYDSDHNGTFETLVNPAVALSGSAASDITPPTLDYRLLCVTNFAQISLTATDDFSGVANIYYSTDGAHFLLYTNTFAVDSKQVPAIYAFATDNSANRSALSGFSLRPGLSIHHSISNTVVITWPDFCLKAVLEQNATLSPADWSQVTPAPQPSGGIFSLELPALSSNRFFRLRW